MGRTEFDLGMASTPPNEVFRGVASLAGTFGDTWKWNASWEMGRNQYYQPWDNEAVESRWNKAYDAVVGPNGQIVCRASVASAANPRRPTRPACPTTPSATSRRRTWRR